MKRSTKELLSGVLILGGGGLAAWGLWQLARKELPIGAKSSTQPVTPTVNASASATFPPLPSVPPMVTAPGVAPTISMPAAPTSSVSTAPTQTVDLPGATAPEVAAAEDAINKLLMGQLTPNT